MNFATSVVCRRCEMPLAANTDEVPAAPLDEVGVATPELRTIDSGPVAPMLRSSDGGRSFGRWVLWIFGVVVSVLTTAYVSLLLTSEPVTPEERQVLMDAIRVLDGAGFSSEASALRRLASFRRTDNWWNRHVGHPTAYAATNFPFGVITIYPTFFKYPVDEVEHAMILLHESYHLSGDDEKFALQRVWMAKDRLGWTSLRYGHTRVWKNTREWTLAEIPSMFTCGEDGRSDCLE